MKYVERDRDEQESTWFKRFSSSGWLTPCLIGILCLGLVGAAVEHGHGNFHKLSDAVIAPPAEPVLPTGPGGQAAIRLMRTATASGSDPEFLSVTLLPGRGLAVLQITASIPGHGEVPLLFAPSTADASQVLTGIGADANGDVGSTVGGAFMVPWAGRLTGAPSSVAGMLESTWNGERLRFPASAGDPRMSVEGLLLKSAADSIQTKVLPDGQSLEAVFHAKSLAEGWPSSLEVTMQIQLSGHALELSLHAQNTGDKAVPFGAGWHPYFALANGGRADAVLTLPSNMVLEKNVRDGLPTGKSVSVAGTEKDFLKASGVAMGSTSVDETYVDLQSGMLADGPISQLRNVGYNYGLRLIPLTPNVSHLRVVAPADKPWISIGPNTNADDPLGSEWGSPAAAGMVMLAPGAGVDWKVRLEISALSSSVKALGTQ